MFTVIFLPHLKSHLTSKGEKNPLASLLKERRAPHLLGAGSALSSGSFSFICATLPSTLMEPVINSALYSSLMLFHSHFVEVVSLPWQKASHFACTSMGTTAHTAANSLETSLPPSAPCHRARDTSVLIAQKCQEPIRGTGLTRAGAGMRDSTAPWAQTTRTGARLEETNQPARCCLRRGRGTKGGIKRRSNDFCFWCSHLSTKAAI